MQTMRLWRAPVQFQQQVLHRYGEPFALRIYPVGDLVVISEPDSMAEVLRGDPAAFRAGEGNGSILPPWIVTRCCSRTANSSVDAGVC